MTQEEREKFSFDFQSQNILKNILNRRNLKIQKSTTFGRKKKLCVRIKCLKDLKKLFLKVAITSVMRGSTISLLHMRFKMKNFVYGNTVMHFITSHFLSNSLHAKIMMHI